jgi:hypothetical protein
MASELDMGRVIMTRTTQILLLAAAAIGIGVAAFTGGVVWAVAVAAALVLAYRIETGAQSG